MANNKRLAQSNDWLSACVSHLEQYSRLNNIEIRNAPGTNVENCPKISELNGDKIACSVTRDDVDTVHRVPSDTPNQMNNIARFRSRDKRFDFVSEEFPIFGNEHLTQDNQVLLAKCMALKKENTWMYLRLDGELRI